MLSISAYNREVSNASDRLCERERGEKRREEEKREEKKRGEERAVSLDFPRNDLVKRIRRHVTANWAPAGTGAVQAPGASAEREMYEESRGLYTCTRGCIGARCWNLTREELRSSSGVGNIVGAHRDSPVYLQYDTFGFHDSRSRETIRQSPAYNRLLDQFIH